MTDTVQPEPLPGGGWISGASISAPRPPRSEYNPASLVFEVQDVLARAGVPCNRSDTLHTAVIAAADLLRALGVDPVTAPQR
jgi:hypothetical protein